MVFNDVHLYAVIFSVVVINYTFQDGKSDYFQGVSQFVMFFFNVLTFNTGVLLSYVTTTPTWG